MTKEEFDNLKPSDVVMNKENGTIKVIVPEKASMEQLTQITKDRLRGQYFHWKIVAKVKEKI